MILYHLIHFITIISTTNMKIYIFLLFAVLLFACGKKTETDSHDDSSTTTKNCGASAMSTNRTRTWGEGGTISIDTTPAHDSVNEVPCTIVLVAV